MTEAVKAKIFEPFFTTKEVGKGSGLGLASVYGIAKTYGGHVEVWSEVNRGTTVTVLLPAVQPLPPVATAVSPAFPIRGDETLLIVEDEPAVRRLMRLALEAQGYKVLEAKDGPEAIQMAQIHLGPINLLLTDMVMPGMGGREVSKQFLGRQPLLELAKLDTSEPYGDTHPEGIFFKESCIDVGGVLAIYYTDAIQFVRPSHRIRSSEFGSNSQSNWSPFATRQELFWGKLETAYSTEGKCPTGRAKIGGVPQHQRV